MKVTQALSIAACAALLAAAAGIAAGIRFRDELVELATGRQMAPMAATAPASAPATGPVATAADEEGGEVYYTCGMHPQIVLPHPGVCPICGMPLTAVHLHHGSTISIDPVMVQNMGVRTVMAERGILRQTIRAVGTLTEPEQNHLEINLRVNGWIEKLYANQEGMPVAKGDPLFDLYSPEITAAADELITAHRAAEAGKNQAGENDGLLGGASAQVLAAARRKLSLLGLSDEQVAAIEKMDKAPATIKITSPMDGHIAQKSVIEGSAVKVGEKLMEIADRHTMWLVVQVYERQLGLVKAGAPVKATVAAMPGKVFEGKVDFIYPHLDPATRTAMVRVILPNPGHELHENMYAEAEIEGGDDQAAVVVPREAVIDTGVRQVVFVSKGDGKFLPQEVKIGRSGELSGGFGGMEGDTGAGQGEMVQVLSGLTENDAVVTSGQFLLDSESRLEEARQKFLPPPSQAGGAP